MQPTKTPVWVSAGFLAAILSAASHAATWYVDDDPGCCNPPPAQCGGTPGSPEFPFCTIHAAVNAAADATVYG